MIPITWGNACQNLINLKSFLSTLKVLNSSFNFSSNSVVRLYDEETGSVTEVPIEEYVVGVVAGEMPIEFEIEALKAQAVAARSYVMIQMERNIKKN